MFKKVLLASTMVLSSVANANLIVDFDLNYQWGEVDPRGVSLDTRLWDQEDIIETIMGSVLPQSFYVQMDLRGNTNSLRGPFVFTTKNSLIASYQTSGEQCLQDTGVLINEFNPFNDDEIIRQASGCYKTVDSYQINLDGLYSLISGEEIDFDTIVNIGGSTEYGLTSAQISIERHYYSMNTRIPGDLDDLVGQTGGYLKAVHHVLNPQLRVVYASEPATLAVFTLGMLGLLSVRRKKKQL